MMPNSRYSDKSKRKITSISSSNNATNTQLVPDLVIPVHITDALSENTVQCSCKSNDNILEKDTINTTLKKELKTNDHTFNNKHRSSYRDNNNDSDLSKITHTTANVAYNIDHIVDYTSTYAKEQWHLDYTNNCYPSYKDRQDKLRNTDAKIRSKKNNTMVTYNNILSIPSHDYYN